MKRSRHPQPRRRDRDVDDAVVHRSLPPKLPGEHRWVAQATYTLTPGQARAGLATRRLVLEPSALLVTAMSCIDCTTELDDAGGALTTACIADAIDEEWT